MANTKRQSIVSLVLLLCVIASSALVWTHRNDIEDWFRLRNYSPPAAVSALANNTTMYGTGKHLFFVNHPEIQNKASFNTNCKDSEQTIVLGCYISHKGIYIYDVKDPRLSGIEEVTAAHEMLHAAYDRLSPSEKQKIDSLTAAAFANLNDARIKKTIAQYRAKDPAIVPNELHSILGTEVRKLPAELELHYKKYFLNRQAVVGYSEKYESEFTTRQQKVADYDAELQTLKSSITSLQDSLTQQLADLNAQRAELDRLSAQKRYEEYNAQVAGFNQKVRAYNAQVAVIQSKIDRYNKIVVLRNALATEENELIKAIDSRPSTVTGQ